MMTSSYKLTDVFPEWLTGGGIFALLEAQVNPPWADAINGASLDVEYFGNRSGSKPCAPLIYKLIDDGELSAENREKLVTAVWNRYGKNWTALYQTTIAEYNPIENYNMVERSTMSDTSTINYGKTNSSSNSREVLNQTSLSLDTTNDGAYSGFNSSTPIPTDSNKTNSKSQGSGRDTTTESATSTDGGTDQTRKNITNDVQRSGNIGVTTSQQLLQSERELWLWNFADSMFADVDTMLTLAVFDHSECINIVKPLGSYELPIASPSVLGGVMPTAKTASMTEAVGVDGAGRLWVQIPEAESYTLPIASATVLGGVKTFNKDNSMLVPVGVDPAGRLWTKSSASPQANGGRWGTVKPTAKTADMLQAVGVDSDGRLWTNSGSAIRNTLEVFLTIGDSGIDVFSSWEDPNIFTYYTGYRPGADLDTAIIFVGAVKPKRTLINVYAGSVVGENGGALFGIFNRYSGGALIDSTPVDAFPDFFSPASTAFSYDNEAFDAYELSELALEDSVSDITAGVTNTYIHLTFYL